MERFIKSKIAKVVAVVTILLSMFATYLPLNSRAEDEAPVEDYVTFNAICAAGATVQSDASIAFNYNWRLTGVQTGFKNVHLIVENGDTQQPYANITLSDTNKLNENSVITNAGTYATVDYGNVRNGTDFSGQALVRFGGVSDFEDYTKSIKLIFEADYRDPIQGGPLQHRRIEVPITVTVQTATEVDSFAANVKIELNKFKDDQTALSAGGFQQFSQDEHLAVHYAFYNGESEYAVDQAKASYRVKIDAENICYGKYILTLQKSKEFDSVAIEDTNSAEALAIDLSQVPNVFNTQIDRKSDGSTDIILTYKTKKENYTVADMDDVVNFDFNIYATYHINYAYSLVVPITSTRTETITTTETVERKSSVTNEVTDGQGNKLQGFYNSATCTVFEYGENGYGSSTTTTYTPISYGRGHDGAYFTKDHQAAGSLNFDNLKVATINKLNGLRLAEGEGETVETVTSHVTGVNSSTSTRTEIDGNSTITYDTTVTETTKEIKIDKTEDKIISTIGSNIQITGRYTAETEGLNLYRDKNGVRIEKRVLNYTNSSECNFLSASIPAVHSAGSEIYGRAQIVDTYLSTLNTTNKIDVTYQTIWNINEREVRPQGESNPDLYIYNYNVSGPQDILDEYNDEHETEIGPSGNISYTNSFRPSVSYRVDDSANSEIITKELTTNIMKVKNIKITVMPTGVDAIYFYKKGETTPFFTATANGDEYTPAVGENIYEYYTKTRLTGTLGKVAGEWDTEWEIDVDQLKAATNMTDENVRNICEVGRRQMGIYSADVTVAYNGLVAIDNPDLTSDKISFFTLDIGNFNTINTNFLTESKTITLKMFKDQYIFKGNSALVYAVNPTFYVKLPEIFDIDNLSVSMNKNPYIYVNNTEIVTAAGEKYLKIECTGTYNSRLLNTATITINFDRTLKDGSATSYQSIYAYMITENENYYRNTANSQLFEYNNTTPTKMGYTYNSYSVEQSQLIQAITSIKVGRKTYKPNSEDGVDSQPEKTAPAIVTTGKTVTYIGQLNNAGKALTNASLLFKLPVKGNYEPTTNSNAKILEDNYKFPAENTFVSDHQGSLNTPLGEDNVVNQITRMTNIADITVYGRQNGKQKTIDPSRYTIYYTNSLAATVYTDISEFTEYDPENSDLSNATAILVVMNSITRGENATIQLSMDMPNEAGMAGAEFGAKYTMQGESTPSTLNSEAAFLINGLDRGTLEIQKVFEGYAAGTAPAGIDFSNVKFKLQDEDGNFVQDNGSDAIQAADSTGKVTFTNLEPGRYKLVEVTNPADIPGYGYISGLTYATIEAGETKSITAVEPKLQGTLKIAKKFEDTNEIKGTATFVVTDSTNSENSYRVTTNEEGIAEIVGLPYGEYIVTEVSGVQGYGIPTISNVILNDEVVTVNVTNPIGKGTIVINKTVPAGQSVSELKFQIDGRAMVSYVDLNDDQVILDKNITLDLSQDYTNTQDIDVVISSDQTSATITLTNLPLGLYTITEIDIPTISQESNITKYVDVTRSVELKTDGQSENVDILNRKKVGYLKLNKTAFVGEGENAVEIGDRSNYQVQITGTSYYGTTENRTISFSEDGKIEVALEIGTYTIKEVSTDGYNVYYKNGTESFVQDSTNAGTSVEIEFDDSQNKGKTKTVDIRNNLVGTGYLRVEKSLEGVTNPQTVVDAGIKFKVTGRNLAGARVEEVININQIDNGNNVAYGVSGPLSVFGEYELEEVVGTVPDYYEAAASRQVSITLDNTQANPRVERVTNTRGKGTLQMLTQTNPEGGELRGIKYRVTEVKFNTNGTYTKLDGTNGTENTVQEISGSNASNNTSFAEITELNAGNYFVELTKIPDGYKMDQPQIVEVPTEGVGVAIFTIDKDEYIKYNRVIINKQILNTQNNVISAADATLAKVDADQSFEVKLINTTTNKVYYTFVKPSVPGIIENVPAGTYELVEEYKPRFNLYGVYNVESGITTSQIQANGQGKILVTITEGTQEQDAIKEITIKNKVNTDMPIGGSTQVDNYGLVTVDPTVFVTQSHIYVVDENGDILPGVEFKLVKRTITLNEHNEEVVTDEEIDVGTEGNRLVTIDKRITIKGVNPGSYMLVCTKVPEGYLVPADKQIQVYNGVTQVSRIEIQEDKPRAALTLSTSYKNKSGDTKYVPLSKYKVVDKATGQLVKFTKTATGDYVKSNLDDASEIITVKSGEVEIDGLEVGTYEVGLVGVTDGYALEKETPETVTLAQNENKHIDVEVVQPKIVSVKAGYYNTMWLDSSGQLWIIGDGNYGEYGNGQITTKPNSIPYKIQFPEDVFITNFDIGYYQVIAIDSLGRVWSWGTQNVICDYNNTNSGKSLTPICLSEYDDTEIIQEYVSQLGEDNTNNMASLYKAYNNGVKFVECQSTANHSVCLLDDSGKVWTWGQTSFTLGVEPRLNELHPLEWRPCCITDVEGNPLYEEYNQGVKIVKLANAANISNEMGAIDSLGRVWMWGENENGEVGNGNTDTTFVPVCISDINDEFASAKIVDLACGQSTYALDSNGDVWVWGYNASGILCNSDANTKVLAPVKLSRDLFNGARIVKVEIKFSSSANTGFFIDEYGKVWTSGSSNYYENGLNSNYFNSTPRCISNDTELNGVEIVDIAGSIFDHVVALDSSSRIWSWGGYNNYGQSGATAYYNASRNPHIIGTDYIKHLEYNLKFKKVVSETNNGSAIALDSFGNVWGVGSPRTLGLGYSSSSYTVPNFTIINSLEGKSVIDIWSNSYGSGMYGALTEDGQVYIWGSYIDNLYKDPVNQYESSMYRPINITSLFNIEDDAKIVKVRTFYDLGLAIDSKNRIWVWGSANSYHTFGDGTTSSHSDITPKCFTTDSTNTLYGIEIVDIDLDNYGAYAIDKNGKLWYWARSTSYGPTTSNALMTSENYQSGYIVKPTAITDLPGTVLYDAYRNGTRFAKIYSQNCYYPSCALDTDGKLWVFYNYYGIGGDSIGSDNEVVCINDYVGHPIYEEAQKYDDYKIEYVSNSYMETFFRDNKGNCWIIDSNGCQKVEDRWNIPSDIIDLYYHGQYSYAIDNYGQLWELDGGRPLSTFIRNMLYNIKIKEIVYPTALVKADTEKGEIYKLDTTTSTFFMYGEEYMSDYLGVELEKTIKYTGSYVGTGSSSGYIPTNYNYQYIVAIDKQGKLWSWGGNAVVLGNNTDEGTIEPVCVSDIQGTELYEATQNGTKFVDIYMTSKSSVYDDINRGDKNIVIAIDNNNKVWTWGYNQGNTPKCLTDIQTSELYTAYSNAFEFEEIIAIQASNNHIVNKYVYAIDNSGELWLLTDEPKCITKSGSDMLSEKNGTGNVREFSEFLLDMIENQKEIDIFNGKIWSRTGGKGSPVFTCLSNVANSELAAKYAAATEQQPFNIVKCGILDYNFNSSYDIKYAIDNSGKLWTWGTKNEFGQLGNGTTTVTSSPTCISDIDGELKTANVQITDIEIKGAEYSSTPSEINIIAKDSNGDYWVWGANKYGELGTGAVGSVLSPHKLTSPVNGTTIDKVVIAYTSDRMYNYSYSYDSALTPSVQYGATTLLLLSNGRMYSAGSNDAGLVFINAGVTPSYTVQNYGFTASAISGRRLYKLAFTQVPNVTNVQNFEVLDAYISSSAYRHEASRVIAYGTGGVYTWGYNRYGELGRGNTTNTYSYMYTTTTSSYTAKEFNIYAPALNSNIPSSIKKIIPTQKGTCVIDQNGHAYYWGQNYTTPIAFDNTVQFTDTYYNVGDYIYLTDSENKLYYIYYGGSGYITAISGINTFINNNIDVIEYTVETTYNGNASNTSLYATLSNGKKYRINGTSIYDANPSDSYSGDAEGKDIIQATINLLVDSDGNLYAKTYDGLYDYSQSDWLLVTDKEYSRRADFQYNQTVVNVPKENEFNGKKYSDIINDQIVKDTENDYWFFPSDNSKAINISEKALGEENPLYGKTIIRTLGTKHVVTAENKVYYIGGDKPQFIMDILPSSDVKDEIFYGFNGYTGSEYYCALDNYGKIWTCGNPSNGALGDSKTYQYKQNSTTPTCISDISGTSLNAKYDPNGIFKIESIYYISGSLYAFDNEGHIWSWGANSYGQLGNGTTASVNTPICLNDIADTELYTASQVAGFKFVKFMTPISNSCYAIDNSGRLWSWGSNSNGVLGNNTTSACYSPKCLNNITGTDLYTASQVAGFAIVDLVYDSTYAALYAIDSDGDYWIVGRNNYGRYGTGSSSNVTTFRKIAGSGSYSGITNYSEVIFASDYTMIKATNGDIWIAGYNNYGRLGKGTTSYVTTFDKIVGTSSYTGIPDATKISITNNRTVITTSNGDMWVAGANSYGQLGNGTTTNVTAFAKIKGTSNYTGIPEDIATIEFYGDRTIATTVSGEVWVTGYNGSGQAGNGTTTNLTSFTKMIGQSAYTSFTDVNDIADVEFNSSYTKITTTSGDVWIAGQNVNGRWGNGGTNNITSFEKIVGSSSYTGITDAVDVVINGDYTMIKTSNGDVWYAGSNSNGKWGNGTTSNITTFTRLFGSSSITGLAGYKDLYVFNNCVYIIDANNKIYVAGSRGSGSVSSPYSIIGDGVYSGNRTSFICITDIADSELYTASREAGFEIEKIHNTYYGTYMIDNKGRVWATGQNPYLGIDGLDSTLFINLSENPESKLYNSYSNGVKAVDMKNSTNYSSVVYVKLDDNGEVCLYNQVGPVSPFSGNASDSSISQSRITEITSAENFGPGGIDEIIDDTHIRANNGKTYEIADDGTLTEVDSYTPGPAPTYTEPVIPNVTVIDYSNYKALDADGNLYVWNQYTGGFKNPPETSTDAINLSEEEYTVAPVMLDSNGWSAVRAAY